MEETHWSFCSLEREFETNRMDYFDNDEDDDEWIFDVSLPGEKRRREEEEEEEEDDMRGAGDDERLFRFDLQRGEMPRRWKNILHKTRHNATLRQTRNTRDGDRLGEAVTSAVREALVTITSEHPNLNGRDRVHFTFQSNAFSQRTNHCFQSTQFRVDEIGDDSEEVSARFDAYMNQLAKQLKSSQSFSPGDGFVMEVTTIQMPEEGGRAKKYDVIKARVRGIQKRSHVVIRNDDNLCCTRAIVTMRAWADEKAGRFPSSSYVSLRRGLPCQKTLALQLAREAGVSTSDLLGLADVEKIQNVLAHVYQIKVMKIGRPHMIVYAGPEAESRILLVLEDGHFDGATTFAGMFNNSYFCHECDRGFDHDDVSHHPCDGRRCQACFEFECEGWMTAMEGRRQEGRSIQPDRLCRRCGRSFFGQVCHARHVEGTGKTMCDRIKKCSKCCKTYSVTFNARGNRTPYAHRCGFAECEHCEKTVELGTHQCFIQRVKKSDDDPKTKKVPTNEVGARTPLGPPKKGMVEVERQPPLMVYADFEAMTDERGFQTPILVCYETSESDESRAIYGEGCTRTFIAEMEGMAIDEDGDDRRVIVVFHNLKGYDGMFLLRHMYDDKRDVSNMVTIGAKVLSFSSGRLTFKDSLCFLPFSLASFPSTFGITELCKGYFPHLFNTKENQSYEGPVPDMEFYDPDGMSEKKREEFERWHATRRGERYLFKLKEDMTKYCRSDVKLLKAGCYKFVGEFKEQAKFDPLERCLTIASACNRYWRKCHLVPKSVAVQPFNGWKGAQTRQSLQARQWLSFLNHSLRGNDLSAPDIVRHAFNGGELRIQGMLVDGIDTTGHVAYEFNGCFFHGCLTCFPKQRLSTTRRGGDRTLQECFEATLAKRKRLQTAGWVVVTMWECQWKNRIKSASRALAEWLTGWNPVTPFGTSRRLFRGEDQCRPAPSRMSRGGREDTLSRCDVTVPVGQQICLVSHGSSQHYHHVCRRPRPWRLFWNGEGDGSSSSRSLPSRPASETRRKTDLSPVSNVRRSANESPHVRQKLPLSAHRPPTTTDRYVVYPGGTRSRPSWIFHSTIARSLALSFQSTEVWTFQGLCQHLVEE